MDLTTLARVRTLLALAAGDVEYDAQITDLITTYSADFERCLDRHVLVAARTETYPVKQFARMVNLRGAPVSVTPTSVLYSDTRDFASSTELVVDQDYTIDLETALIDLRISTAFKRGYIQVAYTSGMAATPAAFIAAYPAIAQAADMQVAYHFRRRDVPGGSRVVEGGSSNYFGELDLLDNVKRVLDMYMRRYL